MPTQFQPSDVKQYLPYIIPLFFLGLVALRNRRPRRLRPQYMWIMPLIFTLLIGLGLWSERHFHPGSATAPVFGAVDAAAWAGGLLLGVVLGYWRGAMTRIECREDGSLWAQASPIGIAIIIGLFIAKSLIRDTLAGSHQAFGLAIADGLLLLAIGTIVTMRIEMFIRAKKLLAAHAAK